MAADRRGLAGEHNPLVLVPSADAADTWDCRKHNNLNFYIQLPEKVDSWLSTSNGMLFATWVEFVRVLRTLNFSEVVFFCDGKISIETEGASGAPLDIALRFLLHQLFVPAL